MKQVHINPNNKKYYSEDFIRGFECGAKRQLLEYNRNTAENVWIPCSERLPDDDELMLVTYVDPRPEAMDIWIGWHEMENVWYIDGEAHSDEFGNEVIAWMPLPKPWKGAEE